MGLNRDPNAQEFRVIDAQIQRAARVFIRSRGLGHRFSSADVEDLEQEARIAFCRWFPANFEYSMLGDINYSSLDDTETHVRQLERAVLVVTNNTLASVSYRYGTPVKFTRWAHVKARVEQSETGELRAAHPTPVAVSEDSRPELAGAMDETSDATRMAIRARFVELLDEATDRHAGIRPSWWRGVEVLGGTPIEKIMERDALDRKQAHRGREALLRLVQRDDTLRDLFEDIGSSVGLFAEVVAEVARRDAVRSIVVPVKRLVVVDPIIVVAQRLPQLDWGVERWGMFPVAPSRRPAPHTPAALPTVMPAWMIDRVMARGSPGAAPSMWSSA